MKKNLFALFFLMLAVFSFVSCGGDDDDNTVNGYEYVDLGLPSGTKWARCNVGATSSESAGSYFSWGEVAETNYSEDDCYTYGISTYELTQYGIVKDYKLTAEYDAATSIMGTGWKMPSKNQFRELLDYCTWVWQENPYGYKVIGENGNSIFLPSTGYMTSGKSLSYKKEGYYWTSEIESNSSYYANAIYFSSGSRYIDTFYRERGRCIRAVTTK